jgi:hypothetical protein
MGRSALRQGLRSGARCASRWSLAAPQRFRAICTGADFHAAADAGLRLEIGRLRELSAQFIEIAVETDAAEASCDA